MSFSQLRLPGSVIAELYRNTLIDLQAETDHVTGTGTPERSEPSSLLYLGTNARNIIVVVEYQAEEYLPSAQLQFLSVILNACNLSLQDIAVINLARQSQIIEELLESLHPRYMLLFGASSARLATIQDVPELEISESGGVSVIKSPSLDDLNKNTREGRLLKSKLWVCLKHLFRVG